MKLLFFFCWLVILSLPSNAQTYSLFPPGSVPKTVTDADAHPVELGVKFKASARGTLTSIRFYKGPKNTGTHTVHLWDDKGNLLASSTAAKETASGWQTVALGSPVVLAANALYVASYHSSGGHYSVDTNYFTNSIANGTLTVPASASVGGNGVYVYSSVPKFPTQSYQASNYWVDVVVNPSTGSSQIDLAWDASPSGNVTGYKLYVGTKSGSYPYTLDAGKNLSATISNLSPGITYFFIARAYTSAGVQSDPSNQIQEVAP